MNTKKDDLVFRLNDCDSDEAYEVIGTADKKTKVDV